jgi:hypothetical protein
MRGDLSDGQLADEVLGGIHSALTDAAFCVATAGAAHYYRNAKMVVKGVVAAKEAAKFRESYLEGTGKLLMFASVVGIARGAKAVKVKMKKGGKVGGSDGVQDPTVVPNSTNRAAHERYKQELREIELMEAARMGEGLKSDPMHRASSFATQGNTKLHQFDITGGDGHPYTLYQRQGVFNEKNGIFEFLKNKEGQITHQRFIKNGKITGLPNQKDIS